VVILVSMKELPTGFILNGMSKMSVIQSVRFLKTRWTKPEARVWLIQHGFNPKYKGDNPQYKNWHAFRQRDPRLVGRMHTQKNTGGDILFVVGSGPS